MAKGLEKQIVKDKKKEESKESEDKSQPSEAAGDASQQIQEVTNQVGDMNFNDGTGADNQQQYADYQNDGQGYDYGNYN